MSRGIYSSGVYVIGIAGGTASGKTTVCKEVMRLLGDTKRRVVIVSQDSFYRKLTADKLELAKMGKYNFDHPEAFDNKLFYDVLCQLKMGKPADVPYYDFVTHSRIPGKEEHIENVDVVLVEGILIFYEEQFRSLFNMRLFVDTDADIRLARRVKRDLMDRGREVDQVLNQYMDFVKPCFENFCFPTKKYADIVIPRGAENLVAIDLIVQRIEHILRMPPRSLSVSPTTGFSDSDADGCIDTDDDDKPLTKSGGFAIAPHPTPTPIAAGSGFH